MATPSSASWRRRRSWASYGTVERRAGRVAARSRVVAADDEVRAAVVLPDDRVPHRLARSAHAHRQRQQRQQRRPGRIAVQQRLVAADAGVVVDVARLRHPHHRVNQQVGLDLLRRAQRQLLVRPVHRVARLERNDARPPQLGELGPQLRRGVAQEPVVVVRDGLHAGQRAADVVRLRPLEQVRHARMLRVRRAEDGLGLGLPIGPPDILDLQRRQHDAFGVAQRQAGAGCERRGQRLGDVQRDRHRPQRAVGETHLRAHALVVAARHEAGERREAPVEQELQVAQLARREVVGRPVARFGPERGGPVLVHDQVHERSAVRRDEVVGQGKRLLLTVSGTTGTLQGITRVAARARSRRCAATACCR